MCGPFIKMELNYWGIDDNLIQPCCWSKYKEFEESEGILRQVGNRLMLVLLLDSLFYRLMHRSVM